MSPEFRTGIPRDESAGTPPRRSPKNIARRVSPLGATGGLSASAAFPRELPGSRRLRRLVVGPAGAPQAGAKAGKEEISSMSPELKINWAAVDLHIKSSPIRQNKKYYDDVVIATSYIGPVKNE